MLNGKTISGKWSFARKMLKTDIVKQFTAQLEYLVTATSVEDGSSEQPADLADAIVSHLERLEDDNAGDDTWKETSTGQILSNFVSNEDTFLNAMIFLDANNLTAPSTFHNAWSKLPSVVNAEVQAWSSADPSCRLTMEKLADIMLPNLSIAVPHWCAMLVSAILEVIDESPQAGLVRITNGLFENDESLKALVRLRAAQLFDTTFFLREL